MLINIPEVDLPGAGFNFKDVTNIFTEAASDMEPGSFFFMEDFALQDAMSAFEIGEPRLDSGLITGEDNNPPFDPTALLLPEELCWILDRSFAYEAEWHAGNLLSHTVFTLLYVHQLAEIGVDFMPSHTTKHDQSRPPELVYVILRTYVLGLLKCCDLSWRELSKGAVQDTEDWQGEKCDISLLEGVPVKYALSQLEEAGTWLMNTTKFPVLWRNALRARVNLRKIILQLMQTDIFSDRTQFEDLINLAHEQLTTIRAHPSPEPSEGSPARLAFDPYIARKLKTFVPIRIVPLPTQEQTWKAFDNLLEGWRELSLLSKTTNLATWELVGYLRNWSPNPAPRTPYLRSCTQSTFYDGLLILNKYTYTWMIERFFFETLGVPYDSLVKTIKQHWTGKESPPINRMERILYKLITPHIRGQWLNPPRRRRHLAKSLVDWHLLYVILLEITDGLDSTTLPEDDIVMQMPNVALLWRLSTIREIVFAGFQLGLLALEEKPIAYWYIADVIGAYLSCLDSMMPVIPRESLAYCEMQFQQQQLTALQEMVTALFVTTMSQISFSWYRLQPAFYRRYKWAFRPEYDKIQTPMVAPPSLARLVPAHSEALRDEWYSPADSIKTAEMILNGLIESKSPRGWAGHWEHDRIQFVRGLVDVCIGLRNLPTSTQEAYDFNIRHLKWDPQIHPWFPSILTPSYEDTTACLNE